MSLDLYGFLTKVNVALEVMCITETI
jgi:hypothetical protein